MGDGRAEGWSATGDGGRAAVSVTPGADGTYVHIFLFFFFVHVFQSSQLKGSCVGDLLYHNKATHVSFWLPGAYKIYVYTILYSSKYETSLS